MYTNPQAAAPSRVANQGHYVMCCCQQQGQTPMWAVVQPVADHDHADASHQPPCTDHAEASDSEVQAADLLCGQLRAGTVLSLTGMLNRVQVRLMLVLAPATCCLAGIGAHEALLLFAR